MGRNSDITEICIAGNDSIGRVHAILHLQDGKVYIEDNQSKNKTYVNGAQVVPGLPAQLLKNGDRIKMSDEDFELRITETEE